MDLKELVKNAADTIKSLEGLTIEYSAAIKLSELLVRLSK